MNLVAHVFGKEGCSKCAALKRRLERLLAKPEYSMIKMEYHDVMTLDGIVDFCKAECLNPNRIPALLMESDGEYVELPKKLWDDLDRNDGPEHGRFSPDATYPYVGTQTNYDGNGVITEQTIQGILDTAIALGNGGQ